MSKITVFRRHVMSVARALYVFATIAIVLMALSLLNIGGH